MQRRIERCYGEIDPFLKFPAGHAAVHQDEAKALVDALIQLVFEPPQFSRYPTGRRRSACMPTVYEVKMMMYLE